MGLNFKNLILQPCMGLFLHGAVKAAAVVEVGVNLVMIIMASVDYATQFDQVWNTKDANVAEFCGYMISWIFCYFYRLVSIGLAIRLLVIVSKRKRKALQWWLFQSAFLYLAWLCCFIMNSIYGFFYSSLSFVTCLLLAIYKLYFFWTIISFSLEIKRNGSIDKAILVLSDKDLDDFFSDSQSDRRNLWFSKNDEKGIEIKVYCVHILGQRYNKTFEVLFNDLTLDTIRPLGSGAFGIVYKASLRRQLANSISSQIVAVKTVLPSPDATFLKSLLRELQILNCIGSHENIVNFVGACTSEVKHGKLYVVMEYCAYGSIQSYLSENRAAIIHNKAYNPTRGDYISWGSQEIIRIHDLIRWAYETANGMEYIASKQKTAKVADFGLSRQLYRYTTFTKRDNEPLPWKWMAIESLEDLQYSTQSDVWGFGLTVWEYFSLGASPYPGETCSSNFIRRLKSGEIKPDQPTLMIKEIYEELCKCWVIDPKSRPSFTELKLFFAKQLLSSIPDTGLIPPSEMQLDLNVIDQSDFEMHI